MVGYGNALVGIGWTISLLHTNRLRKCFSHLRLNPTILLLPPPSDIFMGAGTVNESVVPFLNILRVTQY